MTNKLRLVIAQINILVGDIKGNARKIIETSKKARDEMQADLIIFPELSLTGYPPEDLLLRKDFHAQIRQMLDHIKESIDDIDIVIGYPELIGENLYNSAGVIRAGEMIANYHKQQLPNYGVFDEKRYFRAGTNPCVFNIKGLPIGLTICEDLWFSEPIKQSILAGAKIVISINASPFDIFKAQTREKVLMQRVEEANTAIIYVHNVGGQDEVVFDGRSIVIDEHKEIRHFGPAFKEELIAVDLELTNDKPKITSSYLYEQNSTEKKVYLALVTATRDYIEKNGFPGALIGLSGGIDSALTLAIAVDAIGAERVHAVMMPSRFTAQMSLEDSREMAKTLGVQYSEISIEPIVESALETLAAEFAGAERNFAEENIQARIRGMLLMALSNKFGKLVLTTGNKSEMAVGYATLYGDMAGGFAVLKDVYKTLVYDLVKFRNSISPVIPQRVIDRPPTAELAEGQLDQDHLPPYETLDKILERYVERDQSAAEITAAGFDAAVVKKVIRLVDRNEYKRRQAPPGVKITTRAFGRDRRYPITNGFGRD